MNRYKKSSQADMVILKEDFTASDVDKSDKARCFDLEGNKYYISDPEHNQVCIVTQIDIKDSIIKLSIPCEILSDNEQYKKYVQEKVGTEFINGAAKLLAEFK